MKRLLGFLAFLITSCNAEMDEAWLKQVVSNVDPDGVEWLRKSLKQKVDMRISIANMTVPSLPKGKCQIGPTPHISHPKLIICLSFSVPDTTWIALTKDLRALNGIVVLQGLPNNSFRDLASRLFDLREKGFEAQVELNPLIFQEYKVTKVPTFILPEDGIFDKVSGNISTQCALEIFKAQGETKTAGDLLEILKSKMLNSTI